MFDLSTINFKVNSTEIAEGIAKLKELKDVTESTSAAQSRAAAAASKALEAQAKAESAQEKAARERLKTAEAIEKAENGKADATQRAASKSVQANDAVTESMDRTEKAIQKNELAITFMAEGFSRAQANQMALHKQSGATQEQLDRLGESAKELRTLMGTDTFDNSLGAMQKLRTETKLLNDANEMYKSGLQLTARELTELAREKQRVTTLMKNEGAADRDVAQALDQLEMAYRDVTSARNAFAANINSGNKAMTDQKKALASVEAELQRVKFANEDLNKSLATSSSNGLLRFQKMLEKSGLTAEQQTEKLKAYRHEVELLNKTKQTSTGAKEGPDYGYVTRAVGPQVTDIVVGLTTGQSLMTVMLQQGGQLRDQFGMAGVAAKDMSAIIRVAAAEMVTTMLAVGKAISTAIIGGFYDAGKAAVNFVGTFTGIGPVVKSGVDALEGMGKAGMFAATALRVVGAAAAAAASVGILLIISGLIALAKGAWDATKESDNLAKALYNNSAAFQANHGDVITLAKSMSQMSGNSSDYIALLGEMSKAGNLAAADIKIFGTVGVDMMKWLGMSAEEVVKQYSEMAKDPVKALMELGARTGQVKLETIAYVQELIKQGDKAGATALAMQTLTGVNKDATEQMKRDYSVFGTFIMKLGESIANFFSKVFKDLWYKASPTEKLDQAIADTRDRIAALDKGFGTPIGKNESIRLGFALTDLENQKAMIDSVNESKKQQEKLDSSLAEIAGKVHVDNQKYQTQVQGKEKEFAQAKQVRIELEKTMGEIVDKNSENYKAASKVLVDAKKNETNAQKELNEAIKRENKKDKPKDDRESAKSSVGQINDNSLKELTTQYNMKLALAKEYGAAEEQILKAQLEAGIIQQAEYSYKSNALATEREQKELAIIQEGREKVKAEYDKDVENVKAAYAQQMNANMGLKDATEANIELKKKERLALDNLENRYGTLTAAMDKNTASAETQAKVRKIRSEAEMTAGIIKLQKAWEDLTVTEANLTKQREADAATNERLRFATPEQAVAIKAAAAETKRWAVIIDGFQKAVTQAKKKLDDLLENPPVLGASEEEKKSYSKFVKQATNEWGEAVQNVNKASAKQREDVEKRTSDAVVDYYKSRFDEFNNALASSITTMIFEDGKSGADQLKAYLKKTFLMEPFTIMLKGVLSSISGGIFDLLLGGAGMIMGGSGGGGGALGTAGSMLNTGSSLNTAWGMGSQFLFGGSAGASTGSLVYANGVGMMGGDAIGALYTANGGWVGVPGATTAATTGGTAATTAAIPAGQAGASATAGLGVAAGAVAFIGFVAYLAGMFGDEKQVGNGLTGDLGGDMYGYQLMRESGSLFKGPKYRTIVAEKKIKELDDEIAALKADPKYAGAGEAAREYKLEQLYRQKKRYEDDYGDQIANSKNPINVLQTAYTDLRENVASRADVLGLDGNKVRDMKVSLGSDTIHNDTGGKGLDFTGLTGEEIGEKINKALLGASEELAASVLTEWTEVTREVTTWVGEQVTSEVGESGAIVTTTIWKPVTESVTEMVQVNSQYIREGETALQALTRLSDSLVMVNAVFDTLGVNLLAGSLATADFASKFVDLFGSIENMTTAIDAYYQAFYTEKERMEGAGANIQKELDKKGLKLDLTGILGKAATGDLGTDEIEKFRKEIRDMVTSLLNDGTEESAALAAYLIKIAGNLDALIKYADTADKDAKSTKEDAAKAAADKKKAEEDAAKAAAEELKRTLEDALRNAYESLEKAINKQIEILNTELTERQNTLKTLESIKALLTKNIKDLYNQVDDTKKMLQDQGRQYIRNAITGVEALDQEKLGDAISAVRTGLDEGFYDSLHAEEMAKLVFANELSALQDQTDTQITAEKKQIGLLESQIEYLKGVLDTSKAQLEAALGLNTSVLSVTEAVNAFNAALLGYYAQKDAPKVTEPGKGTGTTGGAVLGGTTTAGSSKPKVTAIGFDAEGRTMWSDGSKTEAKAGENIYSKDSGYVTSGGITESQWDRIKNGESPYGDGKSYKWDEAKQMYVPAFANGGLYGGGVAMVGEEGPELINFNRPGYVHTAGETADIMSGGGSATKADLDNINRALIAVAKNTMKTQNLLDRVIKDGNSISVSVIS